MSTTVRQPKIQIRLQKNVSRKTLVDGVPASERYSGRAREVDLSPYLGERGGVRISKSVRAPAGSFQITLTDMISADAQDSLYGVIEPMDMVEIRLVSDAYLIAQDANFPVIMRGFVSSVQRNEGIAPDGKPTRAVVISGQDYGKIWQIFQLFFFPFNPADQSALLSTLPLAVRDGLGDQNRAAADLVQDIIDKLLNPYLGDMNPEGSQSPVLDLQSDITVTDGAVQPYGLGGQFNGSVYALLMQYCDVGPWNELFIEDRDDAPYVVYRPNPFLKPDGSGPVLDGATAPDVIDITASDVVSMQVGRSDADVANYFWVDAPRYIMTRPEQMRLTGYADDPSQLFVTDYGNVNPKLYGTRKMTEQTQQANPADKLDGMGQPAGAPRDKATLTAAQWIARRRQQLIDQNKDNVVFESGSMRVKGNHMIRAGRYVRLQRGKITADYYAVTVTHDFQPFGHYTTTVQFERGTGFINRAQMAAPGYAERVSVNAE